MALCHGRARRSKCYPRQREMSTEVEERILVLAVGGDAAPVHQAIARCQLQRHECNGASELCRCIGAGAAAIVVDDEALTDAAIAELGAAIAEQPEGSDILILVCGAREIETTRADRLGRDLGNVLLLARPVAAVTMESALRVALRARRRQLAARASQSSGARISSEVDQFLSVLGHELRNPVSAISMAAQVMSLGNSDPARYQPLIQRQTAKLERLIDDLRDAGRIASGRVALDRQRLDLRESVERVVALKEADAAKQALSVAVSVPPVPVHVLADPDRVQQIVGHLLANAVKYTPPGGHVRIALSTESGAARLEVIDDGVGIDSGLLPRVFDLFARAAGRSGQFKAGLGVGLTVVRALVELHGGSVEARSAGMGQGSGFVVRLPLVGTVDPAAPPT